MLDLVRYESLFFCLSTTGLCSFALQVDQFRRQIILMKKYLSVCRVASAEKLLLRLVSRQHFVDGAELYSVEDLVSNRFLKMALFYSKHVFCHLRNMCFVT